MKIPSLPLSFACMSPLVLFAAMVFPLAAHAQDPSSRARNHKHVETLQAASTFHRYLEHVNDFLASSTNSVPSNDSDSDNKENRNRRLNKQAKKELKKAKKNQDPLGQCQTELESCQAQDQVPKYLFVQMANHCQLSRDAEGQYRLLLTDTHKETWAFSDRPMQLEATGSTYDFMTTFDSTFQDSLPNAAVTFVHQEEDTFNGPLVAVFLAEGTPTSESSYTYKLTQSPQQAASMGLDDFFDSPNDNNGQALSPLYADCSIFIDTTGCPPVYGDACPGSVPCSVMALPDCYY